MISTAPVAVIGESSSVETPTSRVGASESSSSVISSGSTVIIGAVVSVTWYVLVAV